jgi:hypothetical protein
MILTSVIVLGAICRAGWLRLRHLMYGAALVVALCCGCTSPPISDSFKWDDLGPSTRNEWEQFWFADAPKHLTPERVSGGIMP